MDWSTVYGETLRLLQEYRDAAWGVLSGAEELLRRTEGCAIALGETLVFIPGSADNTWNSRVSRLFEAQRRTAAIDAGLERVRRYHRDGELYYRVLHITYISEKKTAEWEILDALCLSRTAYYELRRDAVALLGAAMNRFCRAEQGRTKSEHNAY
jgi:hypothetical protein